MSNRESEGEEGRHNDALAAVSRRWSADDRLGPFLKASDSAVLILDGTAGSILHVSPVARSLGDAIAGSDGLVDPALAMGAQIRRAVSDVDRPALARIQFDRRRIQAPVTCLVAQAEVGDRRVTAIVLTSRPPRLRGLAAASSPSFEAPVVPVLPAPSPGPEAEVTLPTDGPLRFTWRSDALDRIAFVAGPAGEFVRDALAGRGWQDLTASRVLTDAEGMLAALAARRTFRAIALVLRRPRSTTPLELELSGAPLARSGQPFAGYAGFGLVRAIAPGEPGYDPAPTEEDDPEAASPLGASVSAWRVESEPVLAEPVLAEPDLHTTSEAPPPSPPNLAVDPDLTGDEHDAFREIARALGVRFAGDGPPKDDDVRHRPGGDVMPFPLFPPRQQEVEAATGAEADHPGGEVVAVLDRLPAGLLIVRGDAVVFANPRLLAMCECDDVAAVTASGGLPSLFQGLASAELTRAEPPVLLARRISGSLPVSVTRAAVDWEGAPADLLLVHEVGAGPSEEQIEAARAAQDITGRRAAATAAILDSLEDGVLTVDPEGRILSLNRRAAALFGLDAREVVGGGVATLFRQESAAEILAAMAKPDDGRQFPLMAHPRGSETSLAFATWLHPLDRGAGGGAVLILREAPEALQADGAALLRSSEAASALRSDVLAKISHEIRTPLNGILGFTDAMLSEQFGPFENDRYRECLLDIRASGEHVLNVVGDLVEIAGLEAGRRDLAFTEVPLNEIVSSCVAMMQPQAARDRIVIRTSFSQNLTRLVADERSVRQAALNVIANAIRFTEAGGQIIVSTTMADRGEIALRVRDTGIGMTPDEVEVALKPYDISAMKPVKGGTGLGLPLTKALVEANHGRFRITSRKDEGTLVEMLFPAAQALSA